MFNRRFHEVKPGLRVFGRCISFADIYVNNRDERRMTVALRNDSDIDVEPEEVTARYAMLRQNGMVELYNGYLVNVDALASMRLSSAEIKLKFEGGEGTKTIIKKNIRSVKSVKGHAAEMPHDQFDQLRSDLQSIQGEVLQNIDNMQATIEGLILQVINLEAGVVNLNAGLSANSLQADSIQVG